ncbi:RNP domain-containing protein [Cordyceps javanica]|uniref:RNP domain-containing protein n=1 Tax=Cordyceps javanica TaxID=43265 RepID=A0A545V1R5_9HYPO|nr:RNP domain-containing protein [Cordyceps javanica]TQW07135.1 RNP domain protein [Cordyceps javanica]
MSSYPPPPGTSSLPARPPPSKGGFKPAFTPSSVQKNQKTAAPLPVTSTTYASYPHRAAPGAQQHQQQHTQYGTPAAAAATAHYGAAASSMSATMPYSYGSQPAAAYGATQQQSYGQQQHGYGASAAPQIRNPFPQPGTAAAAPTSMTAAGGTPAGTEYDAEMAAQIAQWQSAYLPRDPNAKDAKGNPIEPPALPRAAEVSVAQANPDKTVVRRGGGTKWTDDTLLEWDPSHLRLFVGNLGGETTDDALLKAFARWPSVQKARVIRDKRTSKSKGYGFVSFSDADNFFQAAKEMNNKYIQNRPVVVRKANTEIKVTNVKDKNRNNNRNNNRNGNRSGSGGHGHGQQGYDGASLGPKSAAGVVKPGQKTKNGLRLLG